MMGYLYGGFGGPATLGLGFGFGIIGMILKFAIFTLVLLVGLRIMKKYEAHSCCEYYKSESNTEQIVRERYAKGEVTSEEYADIMNTLRNEHK